MRKRLVVKAFAVLALLAAFLVHWPDAAVARAQTAGTPTGSSATTVRVRGTLTDLSTGKCLDDSLGYGLRTNTCNGLDYQNFILTETVDGFLIYDVIQNVHTGSCVDDSLAYGLRGNYCNGLNYQQFFFNFHPDDGTWGIQNLHTGSCLDDSAAYHLRGYYCNDLAYQRWFFIRNG